jgi:hypothetical protein
MFWIWICVDLAHLDMDQDPDYVAIKLANKQKFIL